jgi:hypothetical protein
MFDLTLSSHNKREVLATAHSIKKKSETLSHEVTCPRLQSSVS